VVDVHILHFGKRVKNIVPKIVENSPKTHYFFTREEYLKKRSAKTGSKSVG